MIRIPKKEYLFGTASSLATRPRSASISARSTSGRSSACASTACRPAEKEALAAFFQRVNDDYHHRVRKTDYHDREIRYDYLRLNCAKTIGMAFKLGAGYKDLEVDEREASFRAEGGGGGQRQHSHRDGDEAPQGVERAWVRVGRGAV